MNETDKHTAEQAVLEIRWCVVHLMKQYDVTDDAVDAYDKVVEVIDSYVRGLNIETGERS